VVIWTLVFAKQAMKDAKKLVGDLAGAYSKRINIQYRLVYEVFSKVKTVRVLRMWTHYE